MIPCSHNHQYMVINNFSKLMVWFLHKIKHIQNFNTLYTSNCPLLTLHFMTNETYQDCPKFIVMNIHKYTNILKMISLNYNPYNSCNHFSKSWGCKILCAYTRSLAPFTRTHPFAKNLKQKTFLVLLLIFLHHLIVEFFLSYS
jgi:hypothetical protein